MNAFEKRSEAESALFKNAHRSMGAVLLISAFFPVQLSGDGLLQAAATGLFLAFLWKKRAAAAHFADRALESAQLWQIVAIGLGMRLLSILVLGAEQSGDYRAHEIFAHEVAEGRYLFNPFRPAGPVWFYAACFWALGPSIWSALAANLVLAAALIGLVGRLGELIFSKKTGLWAAFWVALSPEMIAQANFLTVEAAFAVLLFATVAAWFFKPKTAFWALATGFVIGGLHWWRPIAPLMIAALATVDWFSEKKIAAPRWAALTVGLALALAPLGIANRWFYGIWSLDSYHMNGMNVFLATSAEKPGLWNSRDQAAMDSIWRAVESEPNDGRRVIFRANDAFKAAAKARFDQNWPAIVCGSLAFKPYFLWGSPTGAFRALVREKFGPESLASTLWIWLCNAWHKAALLFAALFMAARSTASRAPAHRFLLVLAIGLTLALLFLGVQGRYSNWATGWLVWLAADFLLASSRDPR